MMKNLIKTTLVLLALLLPLLASAHDFEVDGIFYNINGNEATVTYKGSSSSQYSNEYSGSVVIPTTVTYNGVTYSVTAIGGGAFSRCTGLTSIDIPNSVTSIGYNTFYGCTELTSIIISNSVTSIGEWAFSGCSGLTSIIIPNSVTSIGGGAFFGCSGLTSIIIPNSVTSISGSAFSGCTGLTTFNIPNSVTSIGVGAFRECTGLTNIDIPNSVITIGDEAFSRCTRLISINIGNSVSSIGSMAFEGCTGLTSIVVASNNPYYDSRNNCNAIIETASNSLITGCKNTTISYSVTSIGDYAFRGCTGLTTFNIPNSVTSIGNSTFSGCTGLTSIDIPNSVISIGGGAFSGCTGLTTFNIPNSVTSIGNSTFSGCTGLTSIDIPNSVISIGGGAFSGCTGLTSIDIPNSVTSIGDYAFYRCTGLTSISIGNSVSTISIYALCECTELTKIEVVRDNPFFDSRNNCNAIIETASNSLYLGCKNTTIPNTITSISDFAFYECMGLTSIDIPNSVTNIGYRVFENCRNLTSISIPNTVTKIGGWVLSGTAWLDNQPDGVVYAGLFAIDFKGELPNGTIIIKEGTRGICDFAFGSAEGKKDYMNTSLGDNRPYPIKSIIIPNSVIHIGDGAFCGCDIISIYCFAVTPPTCDGYWGVFSTYSATLHVPATSLAAYFTHPVWGQFENIVGDAVAPTGIAISEDSVEVQLGEQFELAATVAPADASIKEVFWYSTDTNVATVEDGIITTVGVGECDIVASCFGIPAICHVVVFNKISLDQQEVMLLPNHMLTLTPNAIVMPEGFTVTSSDPTVAAARVMNGKVQVVGIKEGTTTITVNSSDGTAQPATCLVTVYTEPGDVNCDGFWDVSDVTAIIDHVLGNQGVEIKTANADVNGDGLIDIVDITDLISQILGN